MSESPGVRAFQIANRLNVENMFDIIEISILSKLVVVTSNVNKRNLLFRKRLSRNGFKRSIFYLC